MQATADPFPPETHLCSEFKAQKKAATVFTLRDAAPRAEGFPATTATGWSHQLTAEE